MVNSAPSSTVQRSIVLILPFLPLSSGAFGRPRYLTTGVGVGDVACLFLLLTNVKPSASIRYMGGREGSPRNAKVSGRYLYVTFARAFSSLYFGQLIL